MKLTQCGPTCGFYSLYYINMLTRGIRMTQADIAKLVIREHDKGKTRIGEIFNIQYLASLIRRECDVNAEVILLDKSSKDIPEGLYIIPAKRGETFHYYPVEHFWDKDKVYNTLRRERHITLSEVLKNNALVPDTFNWTGFSTATWNSCNSKMGKLYNLRINPLLAKALIQYDKELKKQVEKSKPQLLQEKVDAKGKIIRIG